MRKFFDVLAMLAHIGWYALVAVAAMLIVAEFVMLHGAPGVCR